MVRKLRKRWQALRAWQIILLFLSIGLVVGVIVGWRSSLPEQERTPPIALPAMPSDAIAIESLSTLGFFSPDIRIRAANGETYMFLEWQEEGQQWSTEYLHETGNDGEPCSAEVISLMQDATDSIVECQTAPIIGEWCPGPITSIAITETGKVWQTNEYKPCTYAYERSILLIEIPFLLLGLVIVIFRWLVPIE
jgi:hypothetical protein